MKKDLEDVFSPVVSRQDRGRIPWKAIFHFFVQKIDFMQIVPMLLLFSIGVCFIYGTGQQAGGAATTLWEKQLTYFLIGGTIYLVLTFLDYRWLGPLSLIAYPTSLILLTYVLFFGVKYYGATRWIKVGGMSIQPSELAKVAVVLTISWLLSLKKVNINHILWFSCVLFLTGLPFYLIYKEPDLGTGLMMVFSVIAIIFCARLKWRYIFIFAVLIPTLAYSVFHSDWMPEYQKKRIMVFLNPELDPHRTGWSPRQAELAVGSGGFSGKGFMQGTISALGYLPQTVSNSDFIFPVIAEEKGFLGTITLVLLYMVLILSILRTALLTEDKFGRNLCVGCGMMLFMHSIVNIGMCIRLAPVTGVPLPLVSYGGTFLIATMTYLGLVHSVYAHNDKKSLFDL